MAAVAFSAHDLSTSQTFLCGIVALCMSCEQGHGWGSPQGVSRSLALLIAIYNWKISGISDAPSTYAGTLASLSAL